MKLQKRNKIPKQFKHWCQKLGLRIRTKHNSITINLPKQDIRYRGLGYSWIIVHRKKEFFITGRDKNDYTCVTALPMSVPETFDEFKKLVYRKKEEINPLYCLNKA